MSSEKAPEPTSIKRLLRGPLPVVFLLGCHFALGYSAAWQKSMTFDEGVHLTGGMIYWSLGDFRMHPENGNWSQRLAALPVYLSGVRFAPTQDDSWDEGSPWEISDHFLFHSGNDLESMLRRGRAVIGLASVALGLVVYLWSRKLFGAYGGLISLTLYAFSPTILANGFLTTSDLLATLFFTLSVGSVWMLLHRVTPLGLAAACVALSGLMLSKSSGVLIVPIAAVLVAVRSTDSTPIEWRVRRSRQVSGLGPQLALFAGIALLEVLGVFLVIWASYGFRYSAFAPEASNEVAQFHVTWDTLYGGLPQYVIAPLQVARDHHLLPEAFLFGFGYTLYSGARPAFLDGVYRSAGSLSFFPLCFAWKTPLSMFAVLALAAAGCRFLRPRAGTGATDAPQRAWWYPLTPLVALWVLYWIIALKSGLNIGHRHILPTYPPLLILAGAAALWFRSPSVKTVDGERRKRVIPADPAPRTVAVARFMTMGALVLAAINAAWTWPNYLAYFNILSGGPDLAYRRLVDSSLDWGQDLKGLKRWLDAHPREASDHGRVYLSYFGMADPEYYGIDAEPLFGFRTRWHDDRPPPALRPGWYCLSATMLQPVYGEYTGHWNKVYEQLYQTLRRAFAVAVENGADLQTCHERAPQLSDHELTMALRSYDELRLGRLCSFLRQREPDAKIGYSLLLYRLTDADLERALLGPPGELLARPENQ
ncbi:MAG TPA: hypothetical protein VHD36_07200 [Pirellulales bacterium]|nr:hypothetical protein [Pirellulales bacterium]